MRIDVHYLSGGSPGHDPGPPPACHSVAAGDAAPSADRPAPPPARPGPPAGPAAPPSDDGCASRGRREPDLWSGSNGGGEGIELDPTGTTNL